MAARSNEKDWVDPTWVQRALNALKEDFDVHPDLKAQMVQFLFDSGLWDAKRLTWEAGISRFNGCLNPGRPEHFKLIEVLAMARRFERFAMFRMQADDYGFELRRRPSEERRQELLEQLVAELRRSNDIAERARVDLGLTSAPVVPGRTHPAVMDGSASFAFDESGDDNPMEGGF